MSMVPEKIAGFCEDEPFYVPSACPIYARSLRSILLCYIKANSQLIYYDSDGMMATLSQKYSKVYALFPARHLRAGTVGQGVI
jgi:hypothetical protein